jgi:hypothetical protein
MLMDDTDDKTYTHFRLLSELRKPEVSFPLAYKLLGHIVRQGNNFNFEIWVHLEPVNIDNTVLYNGTPCNLADINVSKNFSISSLKTEIPSKSYNQQTTSMQPSPLDAASRAATK